MMTPQQCQWFGSSVTAAVRCGIRLASRGHHLWSRTVRCFSGRASCGSNSVAAAAASPAATVAATQPWQRTLLQRLQDKATCLFTTMADTAPMATTGTAKAKAMAATTTTVTSVATSNFTTMTNMPRPRPPGDHSTGNDTRPWEYVQTVLADTLSGQQATLAGRNVKRDCPARRSARPQRHGTVPTPSPSRLVNGGLLCHR